MNHSFKTRSALVRASERALGVRNRPTRSAELVFAEETAAQRKRREQRRRESATIFAICAVVIGTYILIQFAAQVLS